MRSKSRQPRSGMALSAFLSGVALLGGAQVAFANSTAHPAEGVLRLPNVRIEAASASQIAQASKANANPAQSAVRAYKDPVTGELRDQTPEEMMEGGITKAANSGAAKSGIASPFGGVIMLLDDSFMSNAVVVKDAAGNMHQHCVTGHGAAEAVLNGKAGKAHRHDR